MTKSPTGKKKAASTASGRAASKKTKPKVASAVNEIDEREAKKRLRTIYDLEREVERKRVVYVTLKSNAKVAKAELADAEEALAREIGEQRKGPGPLFDEVVADGVHEAPSAIGKKKTELRSVPPPSMPVPPAPSVIDQSSIDAGAST